MKQYKTAIDEIAPRVSDYDIQDRKGWGVARRQGAATGGLLKGL